MRFAIPAHTLINKIADIQIVEKVIDGGGSDGG
jgi:hypothetical protein